MQGLARFSLVAVIVLAAILLGSWAYLVARYGSVADYLASEDAPRYWQPSRSEAHDELADADVSDAPVNEAQGGVNSGKPPEGEENQWRKVPPEETHSKPDQIENPAKGETVEAALDDAFTASTIEIADETFSESKREHALRPFFARTRPARIEDRVGYYEDSTIELMSKPSSWNDELRKETSRAPMRIFHGKVTDKYKRKPVANVVVAPVDAESGAPSFIRAVTNKSGRYLLMIPESMMATFQTKKHDLQFAVIADGFEPEGSKGGDLIVAAKKRSGGEQDFELKQDRGVRVRVTLTNPNFSTEPVRIWCEFRASIASALNDDAIFSSIDATASGSVVFRFPHAIAGTFRVGAGGHECSSDVLENEKMKEGAIVAKLTLFRADTYYMRGKVSGIAGTWKSANSAVRVESLPHHDVTYTDLAGEFEFSVQLADDISHTLIQISHQNRLRREFALDERGYSSNIGGLSFSDAFWTFNEPMEIPVVAVLPELGRDTWSVDWARLYARATGRSEKDWIRQDDRSVDAERTFSHLSWGATEFELRDPSASADRLVLARYRVSPESWTRPEFGDSTGTRGRAVVLKLELVEPTK